MKEGGGENHFHDSLLPSCESTKSTLSGDDFVLFVRASLPPFGPMLSDGGNSSDEVGRRDVGACKRHAEREDLHGEGRHMECAAMIAMPTIR